MMRSALPSAAIAAASIMVGVDCAPGSVLSNWNLLARTNVTSSSEVDGSALIGGNLHGANNYTVQGVTAPGNIGLAVGGNVTGGPISINNGGHFRFGGTVSAIVNTNGGGNQAFDGTIGAQVTAAFDEVSTISSFLTGLAANGSIDGAGNMNAVPTNIGGQLVAVYSFNAASIQSLGQLNLNIGSADSVILNVGSVLGVVDLIAPPNLLGGFSQANSTRILWNFFDATSVVTNNTFNGALVAPNADLQILGGGVNGSVAVNSISVQNAEIRRSIYSGFVPAPGALGMLAMASVAALRRRR